MTINGKEFQAFLNSKGAALDVDGKVGVKTVNALYSLFADRKALAVTNADRQAYAVRLGGTVRQINKVEKVESGGSGYLNSGHPKILYERHYFWKRWQIKIPLISDPAAGGYTIDADKDGINDSWEKLMEACKRNPVAAFESCSWGKFQVMGAWWKKLGYPSVFEFAWSMVSLERGHYEALIRYIEIFGLRAAFQKLSDNPDDNRPFASGYNGKGYAKYSYHVKLARAPER